MVSSLAESQPQPWTRPAHQRAPVDFQDGRRTASQEEEDQMAAAIRASQEEEVQMAAAIKASEEQAQESAQAVTNLEDQQRQYQEMLKNRNFSSNQ